MEKSDYLDVDGRQLRLLLTIHDMGSLTAAANKLDLNQSTVSYQLDKLREHFSDSLFIRSGQGVIPTERAEQLLPQARELLHALKSFSATNEYLPEKDTGTLRIAANALERDLIIKPLLNLARKLAPNLRFEVFTTGSTQDVVRGLRDDDYDLAVFPTLLSAADGIIQRALSPMKELVFYDPEHGSAPKNLQEYCQRQHARVALGPNNKHFEIDDQLAELGLKRQIVLQVGDFDSLAALLKGTNIITAQPSLLEHSCLKGLATSSMPFAMPERKLALFWHARYHNSQRHKYWRQLAAENNVLIQMV